MNDSVFVIMENNSIYHIGSNDYFAYANKKLAYGKLNEIYNEYKIYGQCKKLEWKSDTCISVTMDFGEPEYLTYCILELKLISKVIIKNITTKVIEEYLPDGLFKCLKVEDKKYRITADLNKILFEDANEAVKKMCTVLNFREVGSGVNLMTNVRDWSIVPIDEK